MTVNISNVGTNNTFDFWRNRTNEMAYTFSVLAVTANGSNAAAGNAAITGKFTANSLTINTVAHVNNEIIVGNNTVSLYEYTYINSTAIFLGNSTINSLLDYNSLNTYSVYVGSNVVVNTNQLYITLSSGGVTTNLVANSSTLLLRSNTIVNSTVNSTSIQITNGAALSLLNYDSLSIGNSLINSTSISIVGSNSLFANSQAVAVGSNLVMNTSTLLIGNSSVNSAHSSSLISLSNSSSVANLSSANLTIGTTVVNSTALFAQSGVFSSNIILGPQLYYISTNSVSLNYNSNVNFDGIYANVGGDLYIRGDLIVSGNLTYTGVSSADVLPAENEVYSLGTSSLRWAGLFTTNASITQNLTVGQNATVTANITISQNANISGNVVISRNLSISNGATTVNTSGIYTNGVINATSFRIGNNFVANASYTKTPYLEVLVGTNATIIDGSSVYIGDSSSSVTIRVPNTTISANGQYFLNANGQWALVTSGSVSRGSHTTTGTATQEIDAYSMVSIPAAEYIISVVDNNANNRYMSKILTTHDRGTGYMTEFASVTTNTNIGTFTFIAPNVSHVSLNFTPVSSCTTVRFVRTIVS
jgi:hypothetical protein